MNAPTAPATTDNSPSGPWFAIPAGEELVMTSADYLVDVGASGLAHPVLTIRGDVAEGEQHAVHPGFVTWVLPNGKAAGQVRIDLVTVNGDFRELVARQPQLAPWASALVTGTKRTPRLCGPAQSSWALEANAVAIIGRVRSVEVADGICPDGVFQTMVARSMCFVAEAVEGETDGRAVLRFTAQDCDEAEVDPELLVHAGHAARERLRKHFAQLGLIPAPAIDPTRLGMDDDFVGDHPEVYLVPISHPIVYPKDPAPASASNPLSLRVGHVLEATAGHQALRLSHTEFATPTVLLMQLAEGDGADCEIQVRWKSDGENVASITMRLFEMTDCAAPVLSRHPEAADWLSCIASPAPSGTINLRPDINKAWHGGATNRLVARITMAEVDRDLFRPGFVVDALLQSMRAVREVVAIRSMHQWSVHFTVDATAVLSPDESVGMQDHMHHADLTRRFAATGFIECSPQVQGLFKPKSLQVRLDRHPLFAVPHGHPALSDAGRRTLH